MVQFSYAFFANYMALNNNMICHPCASEFMFCLVTFQCVRCRILNFSINSFANCPEPPSKRKTQRDEHEKRNFFFLISLYANVLSSNKNRTYKLHIGHCQCWFNKYASTVGLLLIYDKYTQMPIIILRFQILLLQTVTLVFCACILLPVQVSSFKFINYSNWILSVVFSFFWIVSETFAWQFNERKFV